MIFNQNFYNFPRVDSKYRTISNTLIFEVAVYKSVLSISKLDMADGRLKKHLISIKICFWGFFGFLITNPLSDFLKSRWRIQQAEGKLTKYPILIEFGKFGFMMSLITNLPKNFPTSRWSTVDKSRKIIRFEWKLVSLDFLSEYSRNRHVHVCVTGVNWVHYIWWKTSSPVYHK